MSLIAAGAVVLAVRIGVLGIFAPDHVTVSVGHHAQDVVAAGGALHVDGHAVAVPSLRIPGAPLVTLTVLGERGPRITRRFRGTVEIALAAGGSSLRIVDELPEDDYLAGTVSLESRGSHTEALKAQAVVARSYLRRGARHASDGYDLCDLTHCQTYRGADGETDAARVAVAATRDEVLVHAGHVAPTYFTSACGGATADVHDVWPGGDEAYPASVACEVCRRHGGFPWQAELALTDVDRALGAGGRLTAITVLERGAGGIVRRARLDGDGRVLGGESLRIALGRALGWNLLKSDNFTVESAGSRLRFAGRGSGHGVGLCEEGAAELARAGLDYRAILRRYFVGATVAARPVESP